MMRRPVLVLVSLLCSLALLTSCSKQKEADSTAASQQSAQPSPELEAALDRITTRALRELPELATSLGVSDEIAGGKYSNRLTDASAQGQERQVQLMRDSRAELAQIDRAALSHDDRVTYDVVAAYLDYCIAGSKFGFGTYGLLPATPYVVTQLSGAYTFIPDFLDSQHAVENLQDAEDYVARLEAFATVLDQETARIKADAEKGVIPPDFAIDGAMKMLSDFAARKPGETVLVQALERKVADAKLDAAAQKDLVSRANAVVGEKVLPAYRRQVAQLKALRKRASHEAGVWHVPNSEGYYQTALRAFNTTSLTPDEIHEMGLKLIGQLHAEMDEILDAQGMTEGTVGERMAKLAKDPKQLYPDTDAGREQLLKDLNQQIADLQPLLPKYFGQLAKAKLEIRRVPPYIEAGSPGGYYQSASLDGSRPGAYYINLRDTAEWPRFTLPTLTYHEGNPGHHWQGSIAQEATGLHLLRGAMLGFSGYWEGWGLYAEQLADEMGVYTVDPFGRLGYLQSMVFRSARLVVDTGMHHKKWSREQAIDYMVGVTGDQESSVATEIERYSVWPGQATAYMVGRETINRLRERARQELGERFDIRGFHDVVLTNGAVPLSVLDNIVAEWTRSRAAAK
jgi:uncharacterized protein (DUF885 family)